LLRFSRSLLQRPQVADPLETFLPNSGDLLQQVQVALGKGVSLSTVDREGARVEGQVDDRTNRRSPSLLYPLPLLPTVLVVQVGAIRGYARLHERDYACVLFLVIRERTIAPIADECIVAHLAGSLVDLVDADAVKLHPQIM